MPTITLKAKSPFLLTCTEAAPVNVPVDAHHTHTLQALPRTAHAVEPAL